MFNKYINRFLNLLVIREMEIFNGMLCYLNYKDE